MLHAVAELGAISSLLSTSFDVDTCVHTLCSLGLSATCINLWTSTQECEVIQWQIFPAGAPEPAESFDDNRDADAQPRCSIPADQQDSMEEDIQRQTKQVQALLTAAHSVMSTALIADSDELQIKAVLDMYSSMLRAARIWATAFQQTSQLLQAGAVLSHSENIPQMLAQGVDVLRLMELAHHSLKPGSPSMARVIRADEEEIRRLLSQLPKETFTGQAAKTIEVSNCVAMTAQPGWSQPMTSHRSAAAD